MKASNHLLALMSTVSFSVFAAKNIEPDNDQLLLVSCQAVTITPEQVHTKPCIYFIKGFLVAAQAVGPPIINQKTKKNAKLFEL